MKDKKRMLMPDTSWDTAAMESWLEEMFAQGWHLTECGFRFAKFRRGEPISVRCRMMPSTNETLETRREREGLYAQLGWEYLTNQTDRYDIYICRDPAVPELETDPVAAAWGRDRLLRKGRRNLILTWLALAAVVAFAVYRIASSETPVEMLIRGVGISAPLSAVLLLWLCGRRRQFSAASASSADRWPPGCPGPTPATGGASAAGQGWFWGPCF